MPVVGVVLKARDADLLQRVCEFRRETLSGFGRRAIMRELARLGYLGQEEEARILELVRGG